MLVYKVRINPGIDRWIVAWVLSMTLYQWCWNDRCHLTFVPKDIEHHENVECMYRELRCPRRNCAFIGSPDRLAEHIELRPEKHEKCVNCHVYVRRHEDAQHICAIEGPLRIDGLFLSFCCSFHFPFFTLNEKSSFNLKKLNLTRVVSVLCVLELEQRFTDVGEPIPVISNEIVNFHKGDFRKNQC